MPPVARAVPVRAVLFAAFLAATAACRSGPPTLPDGGPVSIRTPGAFVAARERDGRYRLNKVIVYDELPAPFPPRIHLIVYEDTAADFDEAARLVRSGNVRPYLRHVDLLVRNFLEREQRVVGWAPLTDADLAEYRRDTYVPPTRSP